jgi:uncharacterized protein (DUF362 family)
MAWTTSPPKANVFIKPNIVFWTRTTPFPKWGVVTTSRVVEDIIILLKERGIDEITLLEGITTYDPKDRKTPAHAFETLGYNVLRKRYGVKTLNVFESPFKRLDLGAGVVLNFNEDVLRSDFVVNLPVPKTQGQTVVSLGIKNLEGLIDVNSRKRCHSPHPIKNLDYMIARLPNKLPFSFTLLDGIYTAERGPFFEGRLRRSNFLIASSDIFSVDKVGAYRSFGLGHGGIKEMAGLEVDPKAIERISHQLGEEAGVFYKTETSRFLSGKGDSPPGGSEALYLYGGDGGSCFQGGDYESEGGRGTGEDQRGQV